MVSIRNFCSDDLIAYVQLVNDIDKANNLDRATSVERVKERLRRPGYYPEEDLFFAELDGLFIGYIDTVRELEIGRVVVDGAVHPDYRRRGIGSRLLKTITEHGRNLGAKVAHIPIAKSLPIARKFAHSNGFRVVRRQYQMRLTEYQEPVIPIPRGFMLSYFTSGDVESLCNLQNRAFANHWGFHPNTVAETSYRVNSPGQGILFLNEGQKKVGYCWTVTHPTAKEKGQIWMIGVDPWYRAQGLGSVILLAAIDYLRKRGVSKIELTVDSRNRKAKRLYQSVGFKTEDTILWYQKELNPD